MVKSVIKEAYGKINLLLKVGGLRPDGKHEVATVLHKVALYDTVRVTLRDGEGIFIKCDDKNVPTDSRNLCFTAAEKYFAAAGVSSAVTVEIEKRIPVTGGMGGGSSDCAATLLALNEICGALSFKETLHIARGLGSDVPFFMYDYRAMIGRGSGDDVTPCPEIKDELYGLFVIHGKKESTARAYALLDELKKSEINSDLVLTRKTDIMLEMLNKGNIAGIIDALENDFEISDEHYNTVKAELEGLGCGKTLLCGSGPTICGLFTDINAADYAYNHIKYPSLICRIN